MAVANSAPRTRPARPRTLAAALRAGYTPGMPDMLVKLYDLPDDAAARARVAEAGVVVRRAMPYDAARLVAWIRAKFSEGWSGEAAAALAQTPTRAFVALDDGRLCGFVVYDATARGMLGPMGVEAADRGKGIGAALLHAALRQMRADGYAYAVIGLVGPADFYALHANAVVIPASEPGLYADFIRTPERDATSDAHPDTHPDAGRGPVP